MRDYAISWIKPWVRWLLFLPLAFIASVLALVLFYFFSRSVMAGFEGPDNIIFNVFFYSLIGIIVTFVFIYVGVFIAPTKKKTVLIVLWLFCILTSIVHSYIEIRFVSDPDYWQMLYSTSMILGGIISYRYIRVRLPWKSKEYREDRYF